MYANNLNIRRRTGGPPPRNTSHPSRMGVKPGTVGKNDTLRSFQSASPSKPLQGGRPMSFNPILADSMMEGMGGGLPGSQSAIEDGFHSDQIDDDGQLPEDQTALQALQPMFEQMTRALDQMARASEQEARTLDQVARTLDQVARNTSSTNDQLKRQNGLLQATADHVSKKMNDVAELAERVEGYLVGPHPATNGYADLFSTE